MGIRNIKSGIQWQHGCDIMNIALIKPLWATSNNIGVELTQNEIFALCGDMESYLISKGIICKGVQVQ